MPVAVAVKFLYCRTPVPPTPELREVELIMAYGAEALMALVIGEVVTDGKVLRLNVSECLKDDMYDERLTQWKLAEKLVDLGRR